MLLHRVFLHDPAAAPGKSGHANYLHKPQGAGRWDNPALYDAWYLSPAAEGAVGETLGNLATWSADMLEHPSGLRRALATFSVDDDLSIFDFDDATNLQHLGMRPSQVVIRNKAFTQSKAAALFAETHHDGRRRWAGVSWWSYHRPSWRNVMLWATPAEPAPLTPQSVQPLTLSSIAVIEAARALSKPLP